MNRHLNQSFHLVVREVLVDRVALVVRRVRGVLVALIHAKRTIQFIAQPPQNKPTYHTGSDDAVRISLEATKA